MFPLFVWKNPIILKIIGGVCLATFGNILEELRKDRKMTQKELSEVIYVTTGTISNYENDRYLPDIEKLIMLADYFNVTIDYLLGRASYNLNPDTFEKPIDTTTTIGSFLKDFIALSANRQSIILGIVNDMKTSMMLNNYKNRE